MIAIDNLVDSSLINVLWVIMVMCIVTWIIMSLLKVMFLLVDKCKTKSRGSKKC